MTSSLYLLYVGMALAMAIFISVLPPVWKIGRWQIVAWPFYSAWGISWVVTGLWFFFQWDWYQYLVIAAVFHVCFPLIITGAQLNYSLRNGQSWETHPAKNTH